MNIIYKYPLEVISSQIVRLPEGAVPLSVGMQGARIVLWAQSDQSPLVTSREIRLVGTGLPFSFETAHTFLGTVQERGFVWHIFIKDLE